MCFRDIISYVVYEAIIENWQEVNRGSGANIYLFTVLAAISLSVVLLWLTNRYVKKFTLQKLLFPLGLSVSSILLGLFFLKLNTFQWIPIEKVKPLDKYPSGP